MTASVLILGAGISGLSVSFFLGHRQNVRILEASNRTMGHCGSFVHSEVVFDQGPHVSFTSNQFVYDILTSRHENDELITLTPLVENLYKDRWVQHPVQHHLEGLPRNMEDAIRRELNSLNEKLQSPNDSYEDWLVANFGSTLFNEFFRPYCLKYWQSDPSELASNWVGERIALPRKKGRLGDRETSHYIAKVRYPRRGGYQTMFDFIACGANVEFNTSAIAIDLEAKVVIDQFGKSWHFDVLVSTIPLPVFLSLVKNPLGEHDAHAALEWTGLSTASFALNQPGLRESTWGYIYDLDVPFARYWQTQFLQPADTKNFLWGLQTESYQRFSNAQALIRDTHEPIPRHKFPKFDSPTKKDLISTGLIDEGTSCEVRHDNFLWANVLFTKETSRALEAVWSSLESYGLAREVDDVHPLTSWNNEGFCASEHSKFSDIIMAGRFAQWKYLWSDDCFLRGRQVAQALRSIS